jgi:hypothetical protein
MSEEIVPSPASKPGWKTSEFWAAIVIPVVPQLAGYLMDRLPDVWQNLVAGIVTSVYIATRGYVKKG